MLSLFFSFLKYRKMNMKVINDRMLRRFINFSGITANFLKLIVGIFISRFICRALSLHGSCQMWHHSPSSGNIADGVTEEGVPILFHSIEHKICNLYCICV